MNAFDLVITVAFGSTFASVIQSGNVSIVEGICAFALLCALQYSVVFLSVRSERFQYLIKAQPTLLYHRGAFRDGDLQRERVTREEVLVAMRGAGAANLSDVDAVVLGIDGSSSVVTGARDGPIGPLEHFRGC